MLSEVLAALVASIDRREPVALITVTAGDGLFADAVGRHCVVWQSEERGPVGKLGIGEIEAQAVVDARAVLSSRNHRTLSYETANGQVHLFVEVQVQPPHLIIVGAGHIAIPLASIAKIAELQVTVLDDRAQYARASRFPTADRVIAGDFRSELRALRGDHETFDTNTYIVLVTRGHSHDVDCLLEVLDDPVAYIGMIGSQRRIRAVFELLEQEQGVAPEKFDSVYAPIGIDIGARTPGEIAICILAEIINVMRDGPAISLSEQIRRERQARRDRAQNHTDSKDS